MISFNNLVCTRYPQTSDPPLPQPWRFGSPSYEQVPPPKMTDREMYEHMRASYARLPPPDACNNERTTRCGSVLNDARQRIDRMMNTKPLINCKHYPGSRETVDAQHSHSPEMTMGAFNTPCPHLRSRTAFDLTHNTSADKALRDRIRRCRVPPVTAVCSRQPDGLIVCTFRSQKQPSH